MADFGMPPDRIEEFDARLAHVEAPHRPYIFSLLALQGEVPLSDAVKRVSDAHQLGTLEPPLHPSLIDEIEGAADEIDILGHVEVNQEAFRFLVQKVVNHGLAEELQ